MTRYEKTVFTSLLVFLPAGIAVAVWFQATHASSSMLAAAGVIVICVVAFVINQAVLIVPLRRRLANAVARQDADALDAVLDETMAMWPRSANMRAFVDGNRAVALMFRERWDEAVVQARGTLARPNPAQEALLLNNLAWALAHVGALEEAATVGQRALATAANEHVRAYASGTLGAVYALRSDGDRALEYLDAADAIDRGGAAIQATRQYYRGVAFRAQRRNAEAIRAFEEACTVAPTSPFGRRSASVLADLRLGP